MLHVEVIWSEGEDGNIAHLAQHGVTPNEAAYVLRHPLAYDKSRSSGRPVVFGYTKSGRKLAVVFEIIDESTVYPITAYDVDQ